MRARTGRSCARSPTCSGRSCPTTRSRRCAPRCSRRIRISRASTQIAPGNAADIGKLAAAGTPDKAPFVSPVTDFYLTNPIARASAIMAECSALARGPSALWRRSRRDDLCRTLDRLPLAADHHGGAVRAAARDPAGRDRLRAARRPQDLGGGADPARPERGRPVGPAAILRGPAEVRAEGADDSGGRQQGRVPAGAARHLRARARRLGGDPGRSRLGDLRHQCRHPLHLRDLLADGLRRDHGGLGVELEVSVPRRAALGRADGVLRGLDRLRDHHGAALRRLAAPDRHRRGAEHQLGPVRLVLAAAVPDVHHLLHLGAGRDQPPAVRSGRGRSRNSSPASWSNTARRPT